jgi:glycosyltransferase involved in cell wall biosynthesis
MVAHVHLLCSWEASGAVKQLMAVVPQLQGRFRFTQETAERGWSGLRKVRSQFLAERPNLLHTIGPTAFQAARWLQFRDRKHFPKWVASGVASLQQDLLGWVQPPVDAVLTHSAGERNRVASTIFARRVQQIRPAVILKPSAEWYDLPERYIVAAGGFDRVADIKLILWTFDVLRYAERDLHLLILGDGPLRNKTEQFIRTLAYDDYRVRFVGWQENVTPILERASMVWITHHLGGTKSALESMALGKPIVAVRNPDLETVITDSVHGLLVPRGEPVGMAAVSRKLLHDPDRQHEFRSAGMKRAAEYPQTDLLAALGNMYDTLMES